MVHADLTLKLQHATGTGTDPSNQKSLWKISATLRLYTYASLCVSELKVLPRAIGDRRIRSPRRVEFTGSHAAAA